MIMHYRSWCNPAAAQLVSSKSYDSNPSLPGLAPEVWMAVSRAGVLGSSWAAGKEGLKPCLV